MNMVFCIYRDWFIFRGYGIEFFYSISVSLQAETKFCLVGEIENADGVGEVGNPVCGDMMSFYIKVEDDKIADIKYKTFGCVTKQPRITEKN